MNISLSSKAIAVFFAVIVVVLSLAHIIVETIYQSGGGRVYGLIHFLNLDRERSLPTVYSYTAILFCAVLLFIIAYTKHQQNDIHTKQWLVLALAFVFLATDEALSIHERLITETVSWTPYYVVGATVLLLSLRKLILELPKLSRTQFIIAGAIYVVGVVGVEAIGGMWLHDRGGGTICVILVTIEEILEMTGIVIFIYALTFYIEQELPTLSITLQQPNKISHAKTNLDNRSA